MAKQHQRTTKASCGVSSKACMAGADDRPSCCAATSPNARDVFSPGNCTMVCKRQRFAVGCNIRRSSITSSSSILLRSDDLAWEGCAKPQTASQTMK